MTEQENGLSTLQQQLGLLKDNQRPPIDQWHPDLSGDIDIEIRADGSWWHEGTQFEREDLMRMFASILRKEGEDYVLVTPVEKWRIQVEDQPFLITLFDRQSDDIHFVTNVGDAGVISAQQPLLASRLNGQDIPIVKVRDELCARVSRNAFYQLAEWAVADENGADYHVESAGRMFSIS